LTLLYAVKCAIAASPGHACAVDREAQVGYPPAGVLRRGTGLPSLMPGAICRARSPISISEEPFYLLRQQIRFRRTPQRLISRSAVIPPSSWYDESTKEVGRHRAAAPYQATDVLIVAVVFTPDLANYGARPAGHAVLGSMGGSGDPPRRCHSPAQGLYQQTGSCGLPQCLRYTNTSPRPHSSPNPREATRPARKLSATDALAPSID
jgi:hypothetical protein